MSAGLGVLVALLFPLDFIATLVYLHAFFKFHDIVESEKPEWIKSKGSLSFFYEGSRKGTDPNTSVAVIRVAFSSRIHELQSPMALAYANRIRFLLPTCLVAFSALMTAFLVLGD